MIRNTHKPGDWLVVDDESGLTVYASETVKLWNGAIVHRSQYETRHPQEFVKARRDPETVPFTRPAPLAVLASSYSNLVGQTGVSARDGVATHIFVVAVSATAFAIPDAEIGNTFIVR